MGLLAAIRKRGKHVAQPVKVKPKVTEDLLCLLPYSWLPFPEDGGRPSRRQLRTVPTQAPKICAVKNLTHSEALYAIACNPGTTYTVVCHVRCSEHDIRSAVCHVRCSEHDIRSARMLNVSDTAPMFRIVAMSVTCKISGFLCAEDENGALLGCYSACGGNSLPAFRERKFSKSVSSYYPESCP